MRFLIATLAAILVVASAASIQPEKDLSLNSLWNEYKEFHGKRYESEIDELVRRQRWESNLKYINKHNLEASMGKHSYTLKMNQFGDMTNSEFGQLMNGLNKMSSKKSSSSHFLAPSNVADIPDSVDWRSKGYVTPVKDQGQCGSCWAFSTVASLEGQHFKASGKLVSLSEQNLVDCSQRFGNMGCNGGLMDQGFAYIKANGGIDTEQSYPYEAVDGRCRFKKEDVGATDTGFSDISSGDEKELTMAIATVGPISVAIDASQSSFQFYSSGVYTEDECSSVQLDHGVTAVGYGSEDGKDFYIVKNSWAATWGDKGYIKMRRNYRNMCGIATSASYPLV